MDRRKFLTDSLVGLGSSAMAASLLSSKLRAENAGGKYNIEYVRKQAPAFEIPPYRGQRYGDKVPDTLDIAERGKLAIHALASITDPEADEEIFWYMDIFRNPPIIRHDFSDWVQVCEGLMKIPAAAPHRHRR